MTPRTGTGGVNFLPDAGFESLLKKLDFNMEISK